MKRLHYLLILLMIPFALRASDHADPQWLKPDQAEANITGLFFFPEGDRMIAILDVYRALTGAPPYNLQNFEYTIHMDTHSPIAFDNPEDLARYGGTISKPEGITDDVTLTFHLNNDTTLKEKSFKGLKSEEDIRIYTGVKDDPFIFPKFFNVNVISMAVSIPKTAFPQNQQNWLLWATTKDTKTGMQIDHVGRSNRTQLGRFDYLNTLPPSQHIAAIDEKTKSIDKLQQFFKDYLPPLANLNQLSGLLIRHYDHVPDVMIYTNSLPAGFPNGRRPADDVALLTCNQGDCPLQENAFIDTKAWPRATVNDKPLLTEFPYLAEPWPAKPQVLAGYSLPYLWEYLIIPVLIIVLFIAGLASLIYLIIQKRKITT